MKYKLSILLASLFVFTSIAQAQTSRPGIAQYETVARLVSQTQTYVQRPGATRQECFDTQTQVRNQERGNTGAVLGALTGAAVGKQIGKGSTAAIATTAAIGAITGDRMQNDNNNGYQTRQCTMVQDPPMEVPSGYSIILSILDEGGEHKLVVQSQNPVRPDQNGMIRIRTAISISQ